MKRQSFHVLALMLWWRVIHPVTVIGLEVLHGITYIKYKRLKIIIIYVSMVKMPHQYNIYSWNNLWMRYMQLYTSSKTLPINKATEESCVIFWVSWFTAKAKHEVPPFKVNRKLAEFFKRSWGKEKFFVSAWWLCSVRSQADSNCGC